MHSITLCICINLVPLTYPANVTQAPDRLRRPLHIVPNKASITKAPRITDNTIPAAAPRLQVETKRKKNIHSQSVSPPVGQYDSVVLPTIIELTLP